MTAQISEKIMIANEEMGLLCEPLESYLKDKPFKFDVPHTACWRGYVGTWELKDNSLFLTDFNGRIDRKEIDLNFLFPNASLVKATWFTGKLRIPTGEMLQDVHGGYSFYLEELEIEIEQGNINKISHKVENEWLSGYTRTTEISWGKMISLIKKYKIEFYPKQGKKKMELGDYRGAIEDFTKAIEQNPNNDNAYSDRGIAKLELEDFEDAIEDFNKTIEINSYEAVHYNNRGCAKYKLNDFEGAIEDYNKAIEIDPNYEMAYSNMKEAEISLSKRSEQSIVVEQSKFEKEVEEDNQLYFTRMGGTGTFYCKDCARKEDIIGFLHGLVNPEYDAITGYQCQSCGKFHKIRSRLEGNQVIYIDPLVCTCGGELSRDKPIFCPHCKSTKSVGYSMRYIT